MAPTKPGVKRQKDDKDKEFYRARLADSAFNPSQSTTSRFSPIPWTWFTNSSDKERYPDPLVARPSPDPKFKVPEGVTAEMTEHWLGMIKTAKAEAK